VDMTNWNDEMRARLLERRTVLVSGDLDDRLAGDVAAQLMLLDATGDGSVQLQIDCTGRSLDAAFAVMDTIDLLGVAVHVTCIGRAEGAAVGVLAVGHHRAVAEHARIRLFDPEVSLAGRASDLAAYATHANERATSFHERLAAATHGRLEDVVQACRAGRYLSAEEAVSFGLADEIASRGATIHAWPGIGLGFRPPARRP
jgi:ATP-dependent Clp protease, protease subunit